MFHPTDRNLSPSEGAEHDGTALRIPISFSWRFASVYLLVTFLRICTHFIGDSFKETCLWEHFGRRGKHAFITCLNAASVAGSSLVLMGLLFMGCNPGEFQEGQHPIKANSGKLTTKVGKRPVKEGQGPIKAMVLSCVSLSGCFGAPRPWWSGICSKRPRERYMAQLRHCYKLREEPLSKNQLVRGFFPRVAEDAFFIVSASSAPSIHVQTATQCIQKMQCQTEPSLAQLQCFSSMFIARLDHFD